MKNYKRKSKQQGVALAIGMILLLVIAVIGVTSMKSALLQEKMAGGLARKGYADTAAYTLLVAVENYLYRQYQNNNGIEDPECDYCGASDDIRGADWYSFISEKDMSLGATYPGSSSLLAALTYYLQDEPKFMVYPLLSDGDNNVGETVGEEGGGAAGGSSGALGNSSEDSQLEFYKISAKANDSTGNVYVIYESVYAIRQN